MVDTLLQARDRGLYDAITDCGAGGLSSAVGEMGEDTGARQSVDEAIAAAMSERWILWQQDQPLSVPGHARYFGVGSRDVTGQRNGCDGRFCSRRHGRWLRRARWRGSWLNRGL